MMMVRSGSKLLLLFLVLPSFMMQVRAASLAPVHSSKGMVVSSSSIASQVGADIMASGGNAVDAAVATAFALAVTYPAAGNIGGGGFAVIRTPQGEVLTNDHREKAPGKASRDMFLDNEGNPQNKLATDSHLASGVPGSVAGLLDIHERYGKLSRKAILDPAIRLARRGFKLPHALARQFEEHRANFESYPASLSKFSRKDGTAFESGDVWKQPLLAKTLQRISRQGRDGFYSGETAELIVAEMKAGGGLITMEDLAAYNSIWRAPVKGTYRDYEIYSMPPPSSGGILLIQMLNMLEPLPRTTRKPWGSASEIHLIVEAQRRAFADRAKHLGDPDFYRVPIAKLIDKNYARQRYGNVKINQASNSNDILPGGVSRRESTQTTHLSAMDAEGWAVALTTTLNLAFGSKIVVTDAGFLLNNEMDDFSIKPGTPNSFQLTGGEANAIEPNKRMLSSMTPTLVVHKGQPFLATGSPGGSYIITTVLQVILNVLDYNMSLADAVAAPRFHHQWQPDFIIIEQPGFSPDTTTLLGQRGHKIRVRRGNSTWGSANSIIRIDGQFQGVSDLRRATGSAVGY